MAIVFRNNPMPTTGALYVTNPRRKMPRRDNGKMHRFIFEELFGKRGSSGKKSKDQTLVRNMIYKGTGGTAAQRKKAQQMRDAIVAKKGKVYQKYLKYRTEATAAYKRVLSGAAKKPKSKAKKQTRVITAKNGRKMYYVKGKLVSAAAYKKATGKSGSRATSQKKTASKQRLTAAQKNAALQIASRKTVTSQAKFVAAAKKKFIFKKSNPSPLGRYLQTIKFSKP